MGLAPRAAPKNHSAVETEQPHTVFLPPSPGHLETSTPAFKGMTGGVHAHRPHACWQNCNKASGFSSWHLQMSPSFPGFWLNTAGCPGCREQPLCSDGASSGHAAGVCGTWTSESLRQDPPFSFLRCVKAGRCRFVINTCKVSALPCSACDQSIFL